MPGPCNDPGSALDWGDCCSHLADAGEPQSRAEPPWTGSSSERDQPQGGSIAHRGRWAHIRALQEPRQSQDPGETS